MDAQLATIQQEPSVGLMLQKIIESGVTEQNVAVLERMADLYERMQNKAAEQQYAAAFVALQSELPVIVASSVIPNRGKYEKYEDVMRVVGPLLIKNGFAVSFEQLADDKRIKVTCHLRHIGGHSTVTPFAVRLGGKADSDTQADCKASTTAKRNALLQALNIVIRQDYLQDEDDARIEGGAISKEKAEELRKRVRNIPDISEMKFLEFCGAADFDAIATSRVPEIEEALTKREEKLSR